jgi:hypothetical protein
VQVFGGHSLKGSCVAVDSIAVLKSILGAGWRRLDGDAFELGGSGR